MLLPLGKEYPEALLGQTHAAILARRFKVFRTDDTQVAASQDKAIDNGVAEFFKQIEGKACPAGPKIVEKSDAGIESPAFQ